MLLSGLVSIVVTAYVLQIDLILVVEGVHLNRYLILIGVCWPSSELRQLLSLRASAGAPTRKRV